MFVSTGVRNPGNTCLDSTDRHDMTLAVNSLPNDIFLDLSKLKAFADNKISVKEKLKFVLGSMENILGKGENAGYQHFLLFPQYFQNASFSRSLKVGIVW